MQFMPMPLEYWQRRFNETNWPLCGTFRSYLFFRIHGLVSDYGRLRNNREEHMLMISHFDGFRGPMEEIEMGGSIRERAANMLEDLDGDYEEAMPIDYPGFKRSVLSLLDQMDEAASRVDWAREQIHQHFLVILDAHDPTADSDLELRAEFNESADIFRAIAWDLKLARDAVLWEGTADSFEHYFSCARKLLTPQSDYEEFRRQYIQHEDPVIFNKLRESISDLELTLEINNLWVQHTR